MKKLTRTKIDFDKAQFVIYHDLPNTQGLAIDDAVPNWYYRTKDYSPESFCEYINSKSHMTGNHAYTEKEYDNIKG